MKNSALEMEIRFQELDTSMPFNEAICEAKLFSSKTKRIMLTELMIVDFSDRYIAEIERKKKSHSLALSKSKFSSPRSDGSSGTCRGRYLGVCV